jgi:hypothetical protein
MSAGACGFDGHARQHRAARVGDDAADRALRGGDSRNEREDHDEQRPRA